MKNIWSTFTTPNFNVGIAYVFTLLTLSLNALTKFIFCTGGSKFLIPVSLSLLYRSWLIKQSSLAVSNIEVISSLPTVNFTFGQSCSLSSAINSLYRPSSSNSKSFSSLKVSTRYLFSWLFAGLPILQCWYWGWSRRKLSHANACRPSHSSSMRLKHHHVLDLALYQMDLLLPPCREFEVRNPVPLDLRKGALTACYSPSR
jgi:hypothetical protein